MESSLGELVKLKRKSLGLKQKDIADMIGKSQGYIADIENNKIENPSKETLIGIANAINMSYQEMASVIVQKNEDPAEREKEIAKAESELTSIALLRSLKNNSKCKIDDATFELLTQAIRYDLILKQKK